MINLIQVFLLKTEYLLNLQDPRDKYTRNSEIQLNWKE